MIYRYYSKFDSNKETITQFAASSIGAAKLYIAKIKRMSIHQVDELYNIEKITGGAK